MKKFLSYILISLVIGANLLAPISVGWGKNNLEVKSNKAEAFIVPTDNAIALSFTPSKTDKSIIIDFSVAYSQIPAPLTEEGVRITKTDPISGNTDPRIVTSSDLTSRGTDDRGYYVYTGSVTFSGLIEGTEYPMNIEARQINQLLWTESNFSGLWNEENSTERDGMIFIAKTDFKVTTNPIGETTLKTEEIQVAMNTNASLPDCAADFWNTIGGCFGQLLYWGIFQPTSFIFGLTGKLLDLSVDYSTKDTSYRSAFVVEGWGLVRDFCNMFFIFVLLYIAFKTILGLGASKTKEMIINVVIIGLLINFSLFATQVIIDASNILTRVFYNSQSIAIGPKIEGVIQDQRGSNGEIKLSEALVAKINPQNLILQASKADNIQTNQTINQDQKGKTGISAKTFILVVILASVVNVVGLITFLMCSLIFISRVIGLWMAMIFAPLAFFSYTIPALQDMEMVGWKKWWPETLKMAFLAPVFIFFMYLIIKFLDTGLGLVINDSASGMNFILGIFIPFIFIMLLLTKAKDIAKKMSGTMGQSITNGLAAAGGIALGGAAIGGALLGRKVIGQTMAKASRGDTATQKYEAAIGNPAAMAKLSNWEKLKGSVGSTVGMGKVYGTNKGTVDPVTGKPIGVEGGIGGILNKAQKKTQETDFARHTTDAAVEAAGFKGKTLNELGGPQQERVKDVFVRDNKSKWAQEEEDKFRAGGNVAGKTFTDKDALNKDEVKELRGNVTARAEKQFAEEVEKAAKGVNAFTRVISKANTGSYDVRKLSSVTSDKRASVFSKIPVALIAAVATGVRGGLKSSGMSNGSVKVEGNFMKDLGNTISDSLKSMKVNVNLEHVGEAKSSGDSHPGH